MIGGWSILATGLGLWAQEEAPLPEPPGSAVPTAAEQLVTAALFRLEASVRSEVGPRGHETEYFQVSEEVGIETARQEYRPSSRAESADVSGEGRGCLADHGGGVRLSTG